MTACEVVPTRDNVILLGEDEAEVRSYLEMALRCKGYQVEAAENGEEVLDYLKRNRNVSAVLLDLLMPRKDGMETLRCIRQMDSSIPVIILSGLSAPVNIVEAMRSGATDFLGKPVGHEELAKAIDKAARRTHAAPKLPAAHESSPAAGPLFFGNNKAMTDIRSSMARIAAADVPILIMGETGSGKEVLARQIHERSARAKKPFLKVNCAAVPSELVESELFGYEKGAFTGAFQRKLGIFELADGGTILLDEIGDMDFKLQAKLLQVLQDSQFIRLGGKDTVRVDVRVIAATHVNLERAIAENRFRQDLFYRLNVVTLRLPPLRQRQDDIPELAEFLLRKNTVSGVPAPLITPELREALVSNPWPGNIRELENVLRRYLIFQDPESLAFELRQKSMHSQAPPIAVAAAAVAVPQAIPVALPQAEDAPSTPQASVLERVIKAKEDAEKEAIMAALKSCRWNRKQAAIILKIDYKALLYKMKKLNIA